MRILFHQSNPRAKKYNYNIKMKVQLLGILMIISGLFYTLIPGIIPNQSLNGVMETEGVIESCYLLSYPSKDPDCIVNVNGMEFQISHYAHTNRDIYAVYDEIIAADELRILYYNDGSLQPLAVYNGDKEIINYDYAYISRKNNAQGFIILGTTVFFMGLIVFFCGMFKQKKTGLRFTYKE